MKAWVQVGYGLPDGIALRDIEAPRIGAGEVLVRVHAASVNALDCHMARGRPYVVRLGARGSSGQKVRGVDVSGCVEAVGPDVHGLVPGDEVFGGGRGSFAEYVATTADRLVLKPAGCTHTEAAALHMAGITALQGLRDTARLHPGHRVLINGAGGGVGTCAVQIATWLGAHVTAVTRTASVSTVRALGADEVIDYHAEDFVQRMTRYDALFDISGNRPLTDCRRVLTKRGTLALVGGPTGRWLAPIDRLFRGAALSLLVSQRIVPVMSKNSAADLALLKQLSDEGKIRAVVDRTYPLRGTAEALAYVATGQARGKVVITVA